MEIVLAKDLKSVVVRLGGLHTLMSAVGSLFNTMKGSGIAEAIGQVYAENSVTHIMTGKAIARAMRALYLVEAALSMKLLEQLISNDQGGANDSCELEECLTEKEFDDIEQLLSTAISSRESDLLEKLHVVTPPALIRVNSLLDKLKTKLKDQSRTARLWIQFLEYISVIKDFVTSERLQSWHGHLRACQGLMNLFAATEHINYAKCSRLYLQMMLQLPTTHPWLYQKFAEDGLHAVRRTAKSCNGYGLI